MSPGTEAIPNSYIVVLKSHESARSFQTSFNTLALRQKNDEFQTRIVHQFLSFPGFHTHLPPDAVKELQSNPDVAYIERDAIMTIDAIKEQRHPPSWGLTRVSEKKLDLKRSYFYDSKAGEGITAYVIDTGVYAGHSEFGGRAKMGPNFVSNATTDDNGHGTHVSGTIAGKTYGVAKKVKIVGIKVLAANGSGPTSGVARGMDWVAANAKRGKSVVNMSLGGGRSQVIDDAAAALHAAGIPLIAAAGNNANVSACDQSPGGAKTAFAVAASDNTDTVAYFTSYGSCVKIFGPGVGITSSWIGSPKAQNTISGTSMATPHVVGVAALYLSEGRIENPDALFEKLTKTANSGFIKGDLKGSPNKLVYNGADKKKGHERSPALPKLPISAPRP
ncbi:putative subtilase-family protease [Mortierella sp. GBAus27b]|nr:putative subtilase-family protease [Mortierella sp. GBAus27b]